MQINFARSLAVAVITSAVVMSGVLASPFQQDDDGVIEGFVFLDDDGDGVLDIAEVGLDGIVVRLEGAETAETETDAAGGYRFGGLMAGTYDVTVEAGEDYATAELDSYRGLTLQKDGDGVETLGDVNFALRELDAEDSAATDADDADAADADDVDSDVDDADADDADSDAADSDADGHADADADEDADHADDDEGVDADEAEAADDEADAAGDSTDAMSLLLTQMIRDMSGEDADEELRASLEAALASAETEGADNEMTAAIQQALSTMDAEADEDADTEDDADDGDEDAGGDADGEGHMDDDADDDADHMDDDAAADHEDADDDSTMGTTDAVGHAGDTADAAAMTKGGMAVDATGAGPEDMPDTGAGGPVSIALLLMLALGLVGGLGRGMERRLGA